MAEQTAHFAIMCLTVGLVGSGMDPQGRWPLRELATDGCTLGRDIQLAEYRKAESGRDEPIVVEFPYDCGRAFHCLSALVSRSKPSTLTDAVSSSRCAPSAAE